MKVCRAFGWTPDQVRGMDMEDFIAALTEIGEVPLVDELFFRSFCRPANSTRFSMRSPLERKLNVARMKQEIQIRE